MTVLITELSEQEITFLRSQRIRPDEVFDGRGMSNPTWKARAKEGQFDFVLAGRCKNGGHRLKTRAGHCIQCRTSSIAFVRRENAEANVYLAAANNRAVIKIGYASRINDREETLRQQGYGGHWDWEILCWVRTQNAGQVERDISHLFSSHRISGSYIKGYEAQEAIEMFSYETDKAITLFQKYTRDELGIDATVINY